jgi:2-C-methyl-D-erythritol 2,4-cyclodiphosphate synthase
MDFRIGFGYDLHRLVDGRKLILGGVEVPSSKGLLGHSDADVLIHAICDALLGAAGMRDIGYHFPDTDPEYKNIDSKKLLLRVRELIRNKGWHIVNIDSTLVLQSPRISPYIEEMQLALAQMLDVEQGKISIKATTNEGLGYIGTGEGAAAYAVALIKRTV